MAEGKREQISIKQQCRLLSIHRNGFYYKPEGESSLNLHLMRLIDEHFLKHPYKGSRRLTEGLKEEGYSVNRKRILKLYRLMGLETIHP
jgi:putative transposase